MNDLHWQIVDAITSSEAQARTEDKVMMTEALAAAGLPHIPILGVFMEDIGPGELSGLLVDGPLFLKPRRGVASKGAMLLQQPNDWLQGLLHGRGHIVQRVLLNHPKLVGYALPLCTVRFLNFLDADGFRWATSPVLKVGRKGAVADNAWRGGAEVRPAGAHLPYWTEAVELNEQAAHVFSDSPYTSTDIGITPDGPVVVEVNSGGAFELHEGFPDAAAYTFFEKNGYLGFAASSASCCRSHPWPSRLP